MYRPSRVTTGHDSRYPSSVNWTTPVPFAFIDHTHRALRVSNGVALLMLFAGGFYLGRHGGRHPWWSGLVMLTLGAGLVLATIALGG